MLNKELAISVTGLRKSYGSHLVLDGVDLAVARGSVFALLGPNGAGKTTLVQILSTLLEADAGQIRVAGHDPAREPDAVRAAIGVTGQFSALDDLLTGEENLRLMADLLHVRRARRRQAVDALLDRFDLAAVARKPVAAYSGGLRRRLDLAMTMVGTPRLIFLDEPTTGLDPRSRRELWRTVRELVDGDGVTVLLTTQYLEEADQLADRVALLSHGRLVAEGTPGDLKRLIPGGHVTVRFADQAALTVPIPDGGVIEALREVLDRLDASVAEVADLTVHTPDLDDVFLALTADSPAGHHPVGRLPAPQTSAAGTEEGTR